MNEFLSHFLFAFSPPFISPGTFISMFFFCISSCPFLNWQSFNKLHKEYFVFLHKGHFKWNVKKEFMIDFIKKLTCKLLWTKVSAKSHHSIKCNVVAFYDVFYSVSRFQLNILLLIAMTVIVWLSAAMLSDLWQSTY